MESRKWASEEHDSKYENDSGFGWRFLVVVVVRGRQQQQSLTRKLLDEVINVRQREELASLPFHQQHVEQQQQQQQHNAKALLLLLYSSRPFPLFLLIHNAE